MTKLSVEQHAQILGFALIGYGLGWAFDGLAVLWKVGHIPEAGLERTVQSLFTAQLFLLLARATVAIVAGVVIRTLMSDPKVVGLLFVFASIYSFPLGTILSAYVLIYLFAIHPQEFDGGVASITSE